MSHHLHVILFVAAASVSVAVRSQEANVDTTVLDSGAEKQIQTPDKVEVEPIAVDEDISTRLHNIFSATGWFDDIEVKTDEGVVFLNGLSDSELHRDWAERMAQRTSDVVAVVNQIRVKARPVWDIQPALVQLRQLGRDFVQLIPLIAVGAMVVCLAYLLAKLAATLARRLTARRMNSQLLQQVTGSIAAVLVMLVGVYIALKVSGLSRLAVTVLGGTGLVGLALGFAFRDIAENYLASVLISLNRPFSVGDLIELEGQKGFVRRVTTRGTLLLTVDGNHIQIPNSTVYKAILINYSSSPRVRKEFVIGIGYDDSVTEAQEVVHDVLTRHESVLNDPPPLVLVDSLGASTINLLTRFWLDTERFDAASVCSVLMRQAKTALSDANISMPDEAREVVFPNGVPVAMIKTDSATTLLGNAERSTSRDHLASRRSSDKVDSTSAEGNLANKDDTIQSHAKDAEPDDGQNLIA